MTRDDWLEVKVTWGTQVLSVRHLRSVQTFVMGDTPIVLDRAGAWLVAKPGSEPVAVHPELAITMEVEGVTIDVAAVPAEKPVFASSLFTRLANSAVGMIALSFIGHLTVVMTMAAFEAPPKKPYVVEEPTTEQLRLMKALLDAAADREQEERIEDEGYFTAGERERRLFRARHPGLPPEEERPYEMHPQERPAPRPDDESGAPLRPRPSIKLQQGKVTSSGKLPVEIIQRIVRQNFGRFRKCYELGLRKNPQLEGTITVKFVIGRDGSVMQVDDGGSELTDQAVITCVVRAFGNLSFPEPEGGIATVNYAIAFRPG